jgi:RHS repeat-associated protein
LLGRDPLLQAYDPWGNLLSISSVSSLYTGCTQENLSVSASAKNQIMSNTYDSAGNLYTEQPGNMQFTYDAENHLVSAGGKTYLYDGDGKRVEKASGSPLVANKLYWYGTQDSPILETDAAGNELYRYFSFAGLLVAREEGNDWVDHYGLDALGNVRWLYSNRGAWDIIDYYPFGGERLSSSTSAGSNTRLFTGKERDPESGLDNFGARYDSSSMGRFMSPDPDNLSGILHMDDDPQSWNGYSYVRNNPLNLTDPTGTVFCRAANDAEQKQGVSQVCDVTDAQYVNSSKDQRAAYDKAGYTHFDCSCDSGADKDAWQHRNGNVSTDWIGNGLVFGAALAGLEGLFYPQLHPPKAPTPAPQPTLVNLADQKATTHILDGDATGGGHAPGTGMPGKSEFPANWSRDRIMDAISDVATDPASKTTTAGRTTLVDGTRDGVNIRVVIRDNRIVTGYPTNLPRNP